MAHLKIHYYEVSIIQEQLASVDKFIKLQKWYCNKIILLNYININHRSYHNIGKNTIIAGTMATLKLHQNLSHSSKSLCSRNMR